MSDSFRETIGPIHGIRAILHDYPFSAAILRELLQNSEDARATKQIFVLDTGDDPALMAFNDSQFCEEDWKAILTIYESSKRADASKIGKYGVGFRACYHITDEPQILSGSSFAVLDPLYSGGMRINYAKFIRTAYRERFDFFSNIFQKSLFPGTVIRLPLRVLPSELSEHIVLVEELDQMIRDYIAEELSFSLLFLNNLKTIEVWEVCNANKTNLATWTKSVRIHKQESRDSPLSIYNSILSNGNEKFSWRVIQTHNADEEAKSPLATQIGGDGRRAINIINHVFKKHKLSPGVRIAYPLFSDGYTSGRLFTFLPLPSKTGFPVHIHATFALTSSRQGLRNRNETGIDAGSENDVLIKWNSLLFDYYIPQAWCCLLKTLAESSVCEDIFSSWPPYCSSITSGDGLYWQNILQATVKFAIQSGFVIWPKISDTDTMPAYMDLKSSVAVARDQVNLDVLIALARLGLTLIQLPSTYMEFLDDSVIKLTSRVAREQLELRSLVGFDDLSQNQRKILSEYFLSDKDFSSIYGFPLFPTLDGFYVSLDTHTSTRRYTALTTEEVDLFRASAGDAVSLDQLQPAVAELVRAKGTTHANIDLLSPSSVVVYLSSEPQPLSNERLANVWSWLEKWEHRDPVMVLLGQSNSTLRLIPTSNGPQLVSSPVFRGADLPSFEKLGLTFVSSTLPSTVIQFLNNHGVFKDTNNLNDFLDAIDLTGLEPLSDVEANSVLDHISTYYRSPSSDNLTKLKQLPVFPVSQSLVGHNTSVKWCAIDSLNVTGISPMTLVPSIDGIDFLDMSCISNPSCSLWKALQVPVLKDKNVVLLALGHFSSQPKHAQAFFVSYIRQNHQSTDSIISVLRNAQFIRSLAGTLQSPMEVIDPQSQLKSLFPTVSSSQLIPIVEDDYDREILDGLRNLGMMRTSLSSDIVQDRISYISANHTLADALTVARFLLPLINDPSFVCGDLSIDRSLRWLPTHVGLVSSNECIDSGRRDADLFDEVLYTLDDAISITQSFRALLHWDKPLPLDVLMKQLDHVLRHPDSDTQYRKVRKIVKELASRQLRDADVNVLRQVITERPWVPTDSNTLVLPSRAVFANNPSSSYFHEIGYSRAEGQVFSFLLKMGCHERPSVPVIMSELGALREKAPTDIVVLQEAVQLLETLPDSITDQERASLLVPIDTGDIVPLHAGVCYHKSGSNFDGGKMAIAHHLISEKLAKKIGIQHLSLDEVESSIDLGGKPITIIRNTLRQYEPKQFFTEFIANASDAAAKRFSILIDDQEGPSEHLLSEGLAVFQGASLVIHNDGIFSPTDFRGILQTGIGGKRGRTSVIGHFGLGALSMFHFTELAMIVSGDHVLFMSPSARNLSFCDRHSLLLPLQSVKRFYADHLKPLNGLFDFDISSTESYRGTLFRLPLRNELHSNQDSVSKIPWSAMDVQQLLLTEFDKLAYKSLLFTGLGRIDIQKRQNGNVDLLRVIESTRISDMSTPDGSFKSETVTFELGDQRKPKWLIVMMNINIPDTFKAELAKKYDMHHVLPICIAAMLDSDPVQEPEYNLFCALPLPVTMALPAHISAPLILEQERRNIRINTERTGIESQYNLWLFSSEIPRLYLYLLERLLQIQGVNIPWWPGVQSRSAITNVPSQIFLDAFWSPENFKKTSRRVFASEYHRTSFLGPNDVILYSNSADKYSGCSPCLSKVLSFSRPLRVSVVPSHLFKYAMKAQLCSLDAAFVRTLLEHTDPPNQWMSMHEINTLLWYLSRHGVPLVGLSLIPLEDGSWAKIHEQGSKKNYVGGPRQTTAYKLFPARLVHRDFDVPNGLLKLRVNISPLDEAGMVELIEERIKPAPEFLGAEVDRVWITSFWDAKLDIPPKKVLHVPLISTLNPHYFISLGRLAERSVTIVDAEKSEEDFDYGILQKLGMIFVLRKDVSFAAEKGELAIYERFLQYMQKNEAKGLKEIFSLKSGDHEELGRWVRLKFCSTPANLTNVARNLPVWSIQQRGKPSRLGALADAEAVLPTSMPSDFLLPFTDHPVINWEIKMQGVEEEGCNARCITELLSIFHGTLLYSPTHEVTYKQFITHFLNFERVTGYSLLVPNEEGVLSPTKNLFERHELFLAAFKATPERLLRSSFQDVAESLGKYGLNLRHQLNLATFIECANAFDDEDDQDDPGEDDGERQDGPDDRDKRRRRKVLYDYFNKIPLNPSDVDRCHELDHLKFIPGGSADRKGYEGMDIRKYMKYDHILSPSKIALADYEAICWSQRSHVAPQPNPTLCSTYQNLGKPTGEEVVKHLIVLTELGKKHNHHSAVLSDLKATYKWLNENVDEIADIKYENRKTIFLNVDDPDSDPWVWHSASTLINDPQDKGDVHNVKDFLRNYVNLLKVAGVRTIHKATTDTIAALDDGFTEANSETCIDEDSKSISHV